MPRYKDLSMLTYKKHIALAVDDYEPYRQKLENHGIAYCQDPNAKMGLKQLFCQDPDGNGVEFTVPESFDEASRKAFEQYDKRGRNLQLEELGVEN